MNLVLFEPGELATPLPHADPRARHITQVLRRAVGEAFVAGVADGPTGVATVRASVAEGLVLDFAPGEPPPPLPPVHLILGLPRPQTARDILRDAATLGAASIRFVATERSDPNYASASLWTSGEWRRHVLGGVSQACDTRLPRVTWTETLAQALADAHGCRLAPDNYEATTSLATALAGRAATEPLTLALGPERGWGAADRHALRAAGFTLCSLGSRVLRLETAVVAALTLALNPADPH